MCKVTVLIIEACYSANRNYFVKEGALRRLIYFIFFLTIVIPPHSSQAARTITLPFEENFNTAGYTADLLWLEGSTPTHTNVTVGCWEGNCAKFTPPTQDSDDYSGLGTFRFSSVQTRVNIRFLIKIGTTFASTARSGAEGLGNKLLIISASSGSRPMIVVRRYDDGTPHYFAPAPCDDADGCNYECGGTPNCYWPNGKDNFTVEDGVGLKDFAGQWVSMELEADAVARTIKLYIYTVGGELAGLYKQVSRPSGGTFSEIQILGGYYNQYNLSDSNTYIMFDELAISNKYIGPPTGFTNAPPRSPEGLRLVP